MATAFVTRVLPGDALERVRAAGHDVDVWPEPRPPSRSELISRGSRADGLLAMLTDRIDGELLDACPRLRVVSNYAVGLDNIDLAAAAERGIPVGHTPDVLTETTADLAFALILASARRLLEGADEVRDGRWGPWQPDHNLGVDVHGATLGIVGFGRIGQAVARRAQGFAMTVVHTRSHSLSELLSQADFVSLHVPLSSSTRGLIGAAELARMKPTAHLINTARGGIVDQDALAATLHAGSLGGAALDVTDPEPLPADHALLRAPRLLVVPHIGSATTAARAGMADAAVSNLLAGLAGEPLPHEAPLR